MLLSRPCNVERYISKCKSKRIYSPLKKQIKQANKAILLLLIVGGRTLAKRNPTRTILGNQAIKQQAKRIYKTKATVEGRTKVCTRKPRNRNKIIRLAIIIYNY